MRNNIFTLLFLTIILGMGCEGKKENSRVEVNEQVKYYGISERDFSHWDSLIDENDVSHGVNGMAYNGEVTASAETAAMIGEALKQSSLVGRNTEESPKFVINKNKYWVVLGTIDKSQDSSTFIYIAVIQKSNGKVLDFKMIGK